VRHVLLLMVLAACNGDDDTNEPADTDEDGGNGSIADDTEAEALYNAAHLPAGAFLMVSLIGGFNGPEDCPAVTTTTNGFTLTGGCTDEDGQTWSGAATYEEGPTEGTLTYDAFQTADADGTLRYDGVQLAAEDGTLTSDMTASGEAQDGQAVAWTYDGHRIDAEAYLGMAFGDPGEYGVSGTVEIAGEGAFALSGSAARTEGGCDLEPDSGTIRAGSATFEHDGAIACDGCIPYAAGSITGTICPYEREDTGG
jgi:hypothetical protein